MPPLSNVSCVGSVSSASIESSVSSVGSEGRVSSVNSVVYSAVLPPSLMVFFNIGYKSLVYYGILLGELFCLHFLHLGRLICLIPTDFNP